MKDKIEDFNRNINRSVACMFSYEGKIVEDMISMVNETDSSVLKENGESIIQRIKKIKDMQTKARFLMDSAHVAVSLIEDAYIKYYLNA